jgi:hypothetical protein
MLATRSDLFIPTTVDAPYHAIVCRQVLFSLDDITTPLPRAITNLLQEFKDIDLILRAMLPNRAAYRTN